MSDKMTPIDAQRIQGATDRNGTSDGFKERAAAAAARNSVKGGGGGGGAKGGGSQR